MTRTNAPTLQDIARETGVSAMTVSVVLHGSRSSARVSDATRSRIVEAAARLRYRPNGVARGLNRRRMDTIGVVSVVDGGEINLYFLAVLNGILEAATKQGQNITVCSLANWESEQSRIPGFCDGRVDGIILVAPPRFSGGFLEDLRRLTPLVMIHGTQPEFATIANMEVDNEPGAYAAVRHLLAHGHRRIAHFTAGLDMREVQQRLSGYCAALEEAGIGYDPELVLQGNYSVWSGRHCMEQALAKWPRAAFPTAFFCASDAIAYGGMEVLAENNMAVPDDVSVVGFDDTLLARSTTPPLTTVRQPFRQMGRRAVERLLMQISGEGLDHAVVSGSEPACAANETNGKEGMNKGAASLPTVLPVSALSDTQVFELELIVRKSVGPPRQQAL